MFCIYFRYINLSFGISLSFYELFFYSNPSSSIIFCFSTGETYLFLRNFFVMLIYHCSWIFWNFCNSISNFNSSQITNCLYCFLNNSFWRSFKAWSLRFWLYLLFRLLLKFYPYFSKRQKPITFYKYSLVSTKYIVIFYIYTLINN